jgi:histidyl-tRNA synthetase
MNKSYLQPLRGFRDFYPKDMAFQNWFYKNLKELSESYGYQEYEGPTLEPLSLYAAKSGEELVKKQAFVFKDKSETLVALIPEMTPTLARMVAEKENILTFPIKWFTYGRRFRYEAPQKGRGREFFQWDIDILGVKNPEADAEIITIAAKFYEKLGLTPEEVKIRINDRSLFSENLLKAGVSQEKIGNVFRIIDKKYKIDDKAFINLLENEKISTPSINKILEILSDLNLFKQSQNLVTIFDLLSKTGVEKYVVYSPYVVRGLNYYTGTVFEGWDLSGKFRSIWGGGRYDNLTAEVGSKQKIPGVGFAMGDMVMEEILKSYNKLPELSVNKTKVLVTIFSSDLQPNSLSLSLSLRSQEIATEIYPDRNVKLDKQLKYADKKDIPWVIIVGPEEVKNNNLVLKNMKTKEQFTTSFDDAVGRIKSS